MAIRWAKAHAGELQGDPQRIVLIGHSAGGQLACLAAVQAEGASSDKLSALSFSIRDARLTAAEARSVLDEFGASSDKLEALQIMRDHIEDPSNWQVLVEAFGSSFDREEARGLAP